MIALETSDREDPQVHDAIIAGLRAHAAENGVTTLPMPLTIAAREGDRLVGAIEGMSNAGWLFIRLLWVDAGHRGKGLGRALMAAAEAESRRRSLRGIWLDTYEYQARPFYEKLGFALFGELDYGPPAGRRYFLAKRL